MTTIKISELPTWTPTTDDILVFVDRADWVTKQADNSEYPVTFLWLTDTPSSYSWQALKLPRVNVLETAIEFYTPSAGWDMLASTYDPVGIAQQVAGLTATQTFSTGVKTFLTGMFALRNVANTFSGLFSNTNTSDRTYTLQNRNGTLADDTDLALKANIASPTFTGTVVLPSGQALIAPVLGTPTSGVATNLTGTATWLTAWITNALKSATTTVDVSSATAPTVWQVLTATSSTAATWQNAGGGAEWTLLDTITPTAVSTFNSATFTAYDKLRIEFDIVASISNMILWFRINWVTTAFFNYNYYSGTTLSSLNNVNYAQIVSYTWIWLWSAGDIYVTGKWTQKIISATVGGYNTWVKLLSWLIDTATNITEINFITVSWWTVTWTVKIYWKNY